ncbi:MAG: ABC transporter permease subunit [Ilumatobacteraceae bacterium]
MRQRALRRVVMFILALALVAACWEIYKYLGPEDGGEILGWRLIPKTSDRAMPHTWEMVGRLFDPEVRGKDTPIWQAVLGYSWFTFRMAFVGLLIGGIFGVALAVVMARFKVLERGLLPYVIASQTVPLIALAPQVAALGGNWDLPKWMWVSTLGAFLAFFPISVATLKGLSSAPAASLELMDSYAASWWSTLTKLRFPAAVPSIIPGVKLAATASVIGVIVSEISTGVRGIGFASLTYAQKATSDPAQVYTAVFGAAALGLIMFGIVVAFEAYVMRNRPQEVPG